MLTLGQLTAFMYVLDLTVSLFHLFHHHKWADLDMCLWKKKPKKYEGNYLKDIFVILTHG